VPGRDPVVAVAGRDELEVLVLPTVRRPLDYRGTGLGGGLLDVDRLAAVRRDQLVEHAGLDRPAATGSRWP
jgi:hypothetical protein